MYLYIMLVCYTTYTNTVKHFGIMRLKNDNHMYILIFYSIYNFLNTI